MYRKDTTVMDIFKEFIVKRELTSNEKVIRLCISVASIALGFAFVMFTFSTTLMIFGMLLAIVSVYIGWQLTVRFLIEYEYIVTNADLDIDKIINQSSRKRLCTVDLHTVSEYGKVTEQTAVGENETLVNARANNPELNDYFLRFKHREYGDCILMFTPSIEAMELIKQSLPRNVKGSL